MTAPGTLAIPRATPTIPEPRRHIALTGDYLWSDVQIPRERFRPLRTSRFRPEAFRASSVA